MIFEDSTPKMVQALAEDGCETLEGGTSPPVAELGSLLVAWTTASTGRAGVEGVDDGGLLETLRC